MIVVREMKYENMLRLTEHLNTNNYYLDLEDGLKISFEQLQFIEPAGAVVFLSTMDKIKEENIPYEIEPINEFKRTAAISYGETMGIFQQIGVSNAPSSTSGSTYIAPTKIELEELRREINIKGITIEQYYEEVSERIVKKALDLLGLAFSQEVEELFIYVVREIIRNIFDHSDTTHYYYALQSYKYSACVEIVIADAGVGLKSTIPFDVEEVWYGQNTDEEAIRKALIPGLSALSNHSYAPEDYKNSGYGLALVKKIIQKSEGLFSIASGRKSFTATNEEEFFAECDIKGTVIRLRINLNNLKSINFEEILVEAEKEAREKGYSQKASTASKTLKSKNRI